VEIPAPFAARGEHIEIRLGAARAVFTTRRGGCSRSPYDTFNLGLTTDDALEAVRANRTMLADSLGVAFLYGRQVHGATVKTSMRPTGPRAALPEADGHATSTPGVAPLVLTADCLPIAVAGDRAVAMLHAGWRGLATGVIARGVDALRALGVDGGLEAAIGPGAGVCCYEVGEDVHAALRSPAQARRGAHADLKLIAAMQLAAAGVETVHDVGLCTICSQRGLFFSHRRDRGRTGRQAGVAWLS
jgi:YfiH family protein